MTTELSPLTDAELEALKIWATRHYPGHPEWPEHQYQGDCPWCRSGNDKVLPEGGSHSLGLQLVTEVQWLRRQLEILTEIGTAQRKEIDRLRAGGEAPKPRAVGRMGFSENLRVFPEPRCGCFNERYREFDQECPQCLGTGVTRNAMRWWSEGT